MSTFQVSYFPPGTTTATVLTIEADRLGFVHNCVVLLDDDRASGEDVLLAVPLALNPVVQEMAAS